jgi:DnaJ-class molecular chaperone
MRWLICFAVAFVGCVASLPADNAETAGVTADLACETARMVTVLRQTLPPTPASDKCENCNGTGRIGDGRIVMTCPVCRGTGKPTATVVRHPPATICPDGSCKVPQR